jgi:hypothetical protein
MTTPDLTDEDAWCNARAADMAACVAREGLDHGRLGEWPAWHVMPYASIWAVESRQRPEWIGWWVICGDLPTDVLPAAGLETPRDALRAFGKRWVAHGQSLDGGTLPQAWRHVPPADLPKLSAQLKARGAALQAWAEDDSAWGEAET